MVDVVAELRPDGVNTEIVRAHKLPVVVGLHEVSLEGVEVGAE